MNARTALATAVLSLAFAGCGDDQDPTGAQLLWDRIAVENYQSWERAPKYETRKPSFTSHSESVEIFMNPILAKSVAERPVKEWPVGSLVVKRGYTIRGNLTLVAAMEKRADAWYFYEYGADGDATFSGRPKLCIDCHKSGADFVWALSLVK